MKFVAIPNIALTKAHCCLGHKGPLTGTTGIYRRLRDALSDTSVILERTQRKTDIAINYLQSNLSCVVHQGSLTQTTGIYPKAQRCPVEHVSHP